MDLAAHGRVVDVVERDARLHTVEHHEWVGSTNDVALARLREGVAPGLVVVADRQTAGRGRRGRRWVDDVDGPSGPANLAVTVALALAGPHVGQVPLATGLAVRDAVLAVASDVEVVLKWPNDVLVRAPAADGTVGEADERKLAGILCERHHLDGHPDGHPDGQAVVLIGCGINVDRRGIEPDADTARWGSIAEVVAREVDRGAVLAALLAALPDRVERALAADPEHRTAYRAVCSTIGRRVRVDHADGSSIVGEAVDVGEDGRLVVDTGHGREHIAAGDTTHLRPATG